MTFLTVHLQAIAWAALTAALLWTPTSGLPQVPVEPSITDPLAHLALFGVLGALVERSRARWRRPWPPVIAGAVCVGWGALLELGQNWVPGRGSQLEDALFNAVGVVVGVVVVRLGGRRRGRSGL